MSKGQTLRALVNERLAAAAEDIFVLFERTIAEYEEELRLSKEENQRKQQLLDTVLYPSIRLNRGNIQVPPVSPEPELSPDVPEPPQIKEEPKQQSVKLEDEQLPVPVPESSGVSVKTELSSLLQQNQTEVREEPRRVDLSSEPQFHSQTEDPCDDAWGPLPIYPVPLIEAEPDGENYDQVQIRDSSTTRPPQNQCVSGKWKWKRHLCPFCSKIFGTKQHLQTHIRVHTGEKPYSCSTCGKTFSQKCNLVKHRRTHTGEKPYRCPVCMKCFSDSFAAKTHTRMHTGERPYSCTVCDKTFARKHYLKAHMSSIHIL